MGWFTRLRVQDCSSHEAQHEGEARPRTQTLYLGGNEASQAAKDAIKAAAGKRLITCNV